MTNLSKKCTILLTVVQIHFYIKADFERIHFKAAKTAKEFFIMKNTFKLLGIIALAAIIGFTAVSCTTTDLKNTMHGEYNMIPKIAGKDFDSLGLVSTKTTETVVVSFLSFNTTITGERVNYDLLLQEAKKLYPEVTDIINVRIDKVYKGTNSPFFWLTGGTTTVDYYGNALAIKYTKALDEARDPLGGRNDRIPGGGAGGTSSFWGEVIDGLKEGLKEAMKKN